MKLTYLAGILALTFGVPLGLQPVFAMAPDVTASPDCEHASACQPGPYNGPLQPTWETFPFGGNSGAVQCNTVTAACGPIAVDPNGRR